MKDVNGLVNRVVDLGCRPIRDDVLWLEADDIDKIGFYAFVVIDVAIITAQSDEENEVVPYSTYQDVILCRIRRIDTPDWLDRFDEK
jgi:hypothetical protein